MIRALVFDFDGLILETETPAHQSWAEIYQEHGHELPMAEMDLSRADLRLSSLAETPLERLLALLSAL